MAIDAGSLQAMTATPSLLLEPLLATRSAGGAGIN